MEESAVNPLLNLEQGKSARAAPRHAPPRAQESVEVTVSAVLDDGKVDALFAWICRALAGEEPYNNMMLAFAAIFGEHKSGSTLGAFVDNALAQLPAEDTTVGEPLSLKEREGASLGAMGAAQWTGTRRTRPHALLDVRELSSVEEWVGRLPRGARRTLSKALAQNFTVIVRPIRGGEPAPHSTLAHFRCVVEHQMRLIADSPNEFFGALNQAVGRYLNSVGQAGEIREYRDAEGRLLAFAHEVTKGRVIRGQWFYSTNKAAKRFVWFHSIQDLVGRAIGSEDVDMVDLGPSGSDDFSALKAKYGFDSVSNWHRVADYRGPFRYGNETGPSWAELDPPDWLFEKDSLARMIQAWVGARPSPASNKT